MNLPQCGAHTFTISSYGLQESYLAFFDPRARVCLVSCRVCLFSLANTYSCLEWYFFANSSRSRNSTLLHTAAPQPKNHNNTSVKCNLAWSLHFILHWRGTFYHHLALIVIRFWTTAAKYCTNYTTFDTEVKTIETNYCTNIYNNISLDIFGPQWKHWKHGCW